MPHTGKTRPSNSSLFINCYMVSIGNILFFLVNVENLSLSFFFFPYKISKEEIANIQSISDGANLSDRFFLHR